MTEQDEVTAKSFILLQFSGFQSTDMAMSLNNVSPMQLLAAAEYLRFKGEYMLTQIEKQREEQESLRRIATPQKSEILIGR